MDVVVAYVEREAVESIREELLELGFVGLSIIESSGALPEGIVTGSYRGLTVEQHRRPNSRLECVVGDGQAQTVVDTVAKHGGDRYFAFVVPVASAFPTDTVKVAEPVAAA
jgi:nitrogen regulatory protein PII